MDNYQWNRIDKPTSGFQGNFTTEKLAQGKNILISISKSGHNYVARKKDNEGWSKQNTGFSGTYNAITYGDGKFVIVGSDNYDGENGHPLFISSEDGVKWTRGEIVTSGTGYTLYDVIWTGEKFVAIGGANTIYSSSDGNRWYRYPRENIIHNKGAKYYYDFKNISSNGDYIIAYSEKGNAVLISKDGGKNWIQRQDSNYLKLIDIIVINKGDGIIDPKNLNVRWYR